MSSVDVYPRGIVVTADYLVRHSLHFLGYLVVCLTHEPFDGEHCLVRVRDGLPFGRITDFPFAAVSESDYGRGSPLSLIVDDDGRLVAFHDCHARVRGSQVNTNDFSHNIYLLFIYFPFLRPAEKETFLYKP